MNLVQLSGPFPHFLFKSELFCCVMRNERIFYGKVRENKCILHDVSLFLYVIGHNTWSENKSCPNPRSFFRIPFPDEY